jgi:thioredoxin reductase (NADPH)
MSKHELLIVGAGPAGMSAALNAQNDELNFRLIESTEEGWFPRVSVDSHYTVDNYLGFSKVSGSEIISKFQQHLINNGIVSLREKVESIRTREKLFEIQTNRNNYESDSLILATGTKQKKLDVLGIDRFLGNSVFYYCVPDGEQFMNKKVLVVGGRNTGAVTALYLDKLGCNVEVIERDSKLNAKTKYASRIMNAGIPFRTGTEIVSLNGSNSLESVTLKTPKGLEEIAAQGVFVCIGLEPNNDLAKQIGVVLDKLGYILVDHHMSTNIEGVYAAGDVTGNLKQMVVAAAQGSIAAYNVSKYLRSKCKE